MKNKILILGSSGFIGQYLYKKLKLKNIIFRSHIKNRRCINLNNTSKIKTYLKKNKINFIINLVNNLDYQKVGSLSNEVVEKLSNIKPPTLGSASRVSGVTPAAIIAILRYLKKNKKTKAA